MGLFTLFGKCVLGKSVLNKEYRDLYFRGCHLNPVLSLATLLAKKIGFKHFVCYLIAQFVGSFCGAMLVRVIFISTY